MNDCKNMDPSNANIPKSKHKNTTIMSGAAFSMGSPERPHCWTVLNERSYDFR